MLLHLQLGADCHWAHRKFGWLYPVRTLSYRGAAVLVFLPVLLCGAAPRPVVLPPLDPELRAQKPHDERMGIRRAVSIASRDGDWSTDAHGTRTWTATIAAPDAHGLRVHFEDFHAGAGQVWIYDPAAPQTRIFGPYSGEGPRGYGSFWTETLFTNAVGVRYQPAPGAASELPFRVSEVFHWWRHLPSLSHVSPQFTPSENYRCFKDVQCYWGTDHVKQVAESSVLILTDLGGCSGTLIQDGNNTGTPFLLTAGHCISAQSDADFLDVFFGYRTPGCSDPTGGGFGTLDDVDFFFNLPQVVGATLISESFQAGGNNSNGEETVDLSQLDYSFVLLSGVPQGIEYQSVTLNPNGKIFDKVFSVSHPELLPQAYASGSISNYVDGVNYFSADYLVGLTDHGSSGSGLFDLNGALLGVASFGTADEGPSEDACDVSGPQYAGYTNVAGFLSSISPYLTGTAETSLPVAWSASPNPAFAPPGVSPEITLNWNAPGHRTLISINAPDGSILNSKSPAAGSTQTGPWVTDGMQFFLLDADTHKVLSSFTESVVAVDPITFDALVNPVLLSGRGLIFNDILEFQAPYHQHVQIYSDGIPLSDVLSTSETDYFEVTLHAGDTKQYDLIDADTGSTLASVTVSAELHQIEPLNPRPPVIPPH